MFNIICVTDRSLCQGDFLRQMEAIAAAGPDGIILREKDLEEADYRDLARDVLALCARHQVPCILHSFPQVALDLESDAIHLPLPVLRTLNEEQKSRFRIIGASCHSVPEALEAQRLGCTYLTAGHVFETDCKRGLPGRGLDFLKDVCTAVPLPVYAIGGISADNLEAVARAGARGACLMSGFMQCQDPAGLLHTLKKAGDHCGHP
ncbi:MAG: thiamine phosphate synthase [Ruminiclostridium sp.]|nr:thiamine phosphate synthase [Ruminiclostridium sp.]